MQGDSSSSSPEVDKTFSFVPTTATSSNTAAAITTTTTASSSNRRGSSLGTAGESFKASHGAPGSSYSTKKHADEAERMMKFVLDKDWDPKQYGDSLMKDGALKPAT